jgi:hypothetical protein
VPVEINHIEPWSKVKQHTFDNLIALCPTCHARYMRGEIDRESMQMYKLNLGVAVTTKPRPPAGAGAPSSHSQR